MSFATSSNGSRGGGARKRSPYSACNDAAADSSTSSPIMSDSASGPIGWPAPSFIASSMSSADAWPASNMAMA